MARKDYDKDANVRDVLIELICDLCVRGILPADYLWKIGESHDHSREDVPRLLAEVDRLQAEVLELQDELDDRKAGIR